jgi:hypothetical protein
MSLTHVMPTFLRCLQIQEVHVSLGFSSHHGSRHLCCAWSAILIDGQLLQLPGGWQDMSVGQNVLPLSFLHAIVDGCTQVDSSKSTAVFQPQVEQSPGGLHVMSSGQ